MEIDFQKILKIEKLDLKEDDVIVVTYADDNDLNTYEMIDRLMEDMTDLCKEKKVYCIYIPSSMELKSATKEEAIKQLESIIEELRK